MKSRNRCLCGTTSGDRISPERLATLMTAEDVLKALGRYTRESNQTDQQTAAALGIKRATLGAWLQGTDPPEKGMVARLAGFLRRAGYL
jgi:transcriptional regulator with XRE-family HTH domain